MKSMSSGVGQAAKFCARFGAGVLAAPTMIAGVAITVAGSAAAMGLVIPGIIAGVGATIASGNEKAFEPVSKAVTYSVAALGVGIVMIGAAEMQYAAKGTLKDPEEKKQAPVLHDLIDLKVELEKGRSTVANEETKTIHSFRR